MRIVSRRTGLSAEILRVWERRYGVVSPGRTHTGRRLYSDADIERLLLLRRATLGGRSIGTIAGLPNAALEELVRQDAEADLAGGAPMARSAGDYPAGRLVAEGMRAIELFDLDALGAVLRRGSVALPVLEFLEGVVGALLHQVGTRWRDGTFRAVHGHLAANGVRRVLEQMTVAGPDSAPRLVLATPLGQVHDLGAMMAGVNAAAEAWSVTWLGANLPAADIAHAAVSLRARAVGVSLLHPAEEPLITDELRRLRSLLPRSIHLFVGGTAMVAGMTAFEEIGCTPVKDMTEFTNQLRLLYPRKRSRHGSGAATDDSPRIRKTRRSS